MTRYKKRTLWIAERAHELEHDIAAAVEMAGRVVVMFDPDAFTKSFGQFHNIVALSLTGDELWKAELPTTTSGDRYYRFELDGDGERPPDPRCQRELGHWRVDRLPWEFPECRAQLAAGSRLDVRSCN